METLWIFTKNLNITKAIAEFVIDDLQTLSTIESPSFRNLIDAIDPRYKHMSRRYLTDTFIPKLYNELCDILKAETSTVKDVALTHDMWTSAST